MSHMKIPDSVLDRIRCSCGQYLSKIPIKIKDGESICKNCVEEQAPVPAVTSRNAPYEALAALFAFPCQYKTHGCLKYVEFDKLENHEIECSYRIYECPTNLHLSDLSCTWKDTISQLCDHYQNYHPDFYLESPTFKINTDEDYEVYRLFKADGIPLLLQAKCGVERARLWFNMVCFRQPDSVPLINFTITLSSVENTERTMKLELTNPLPVSGIHMSPEKSLDVSISTVKDFFKDPDLIECYWTVSVSDELKQKIQDEEKLEERLSWEARSAAIKCINCGIYMVPPIYRCCYGHLTCVDCKGYYNTCKTCQKSDLTFLVAGGLEELARSEPHFCRWVNCTAMLPYTDVRQHEQTCPERIYTCPRCNIWSGILEKLPRHFQSAHPETVVYEAPFVSFNCDDNVSAYVVAHGELFKLVVDLESHNVFSTVIKRIKVDLWYLGPPSFSDRWNCKVMEDSGSSWTLSTALNRRSTSIMIDPPQEHDSQDDNQTKVPHSIFSGASTSNPAPPTCRFSLPSAPAPFFFASAPIPINNQNIFSSSQTKPEDGLFSSRSAAIASQRSQNGAPTRNYEFAPAKFPTETVTSHFQTRKKHCGNQQPNENENGGNVSKTYTLTISRLNEA